MRSIAVGIALTLAAVRADTRPTVPPEVLALYKSPPTIELVTMGVGSLIWERHGHIALCVHYDDPHDDRCYNYGIGDFYHPLRMAWGFFRGTGSFWVGKSPVVMPGHRFTLRLRFRTRGRYEYFSTLHDQAEAGFVGFLTVR